MQALFFAACDRNELAYQSSVCRRDYSLTPRRQDAKNPNEARAAKFAAGVAAWREI